MIVQLPSIGDIDDTAAADDIVDDRPGSTAGKEKAGEKLAVVYEEDMPVRFLKKFFTRRTRIFYSEE